MAGGRLTATYLPSAEFPTGKRFRAAIGGLGRSYQFRRDIGVFGDALPDRIGFAIAADPLR
jgi:hypothetical protein